MTAIAAVQSPRARRSTFAPEQAHNRHASRKRATRSPRPSRHACCYLASPDRPQRFMQEPKVFPVTTAPADTARVRHAVFPVAGFGTSFLPATTACPKEMLAIGGGAL